MSLLSFAVAIVVFFVIYWALHKLAAAFDVSAQIVTVLDVLLVVIAVCWVIQAIGGLGVSLRLW